MAEAREKKAKMGVDEARPQMKRLRGEIKGCAAVEG